MLQEKQVYQGPAFLFMLVDLLKVMLMIWCLIIIGDFVITEKSLN